MASLAGVLPNLLFVLEPLLVDTRSSMRAATRMPGDRERAQRPRPDDPIGGEIARVLEANHRRLGPRAEQPVRWPGPLPGIPQPTLHHPYSRGAAALPVARARAHQSRI